MEAVMENGIQNAQLVGRSVKVFCPATIANVSCGFDVLGIALDAPGDEMVVTITETPGIDIPPAIGAPDLPTDPKKNVAGVAIQSMIDRLDFKLGVRIQIKKVIKPGSGLGSSSASAAGSVFALNQLLGKPFNKTQLIECAMAGEAAATGVEHADNVAPAITGGIALVRSYTPLDIIKIDCPSELHCAVIHPQIEIKTADARQVLKQRVELKSAVRQWGNVAGLIAGFYRNDYELIGRSLQDEIIEPTRSLLIPGFDKVKTAALDAGALGAGISGSGPSIFALCKGEESSIKVKEAMCTAFAGIQIDFEAHASPVNPHGMKVQELNF